MRSPDKALLLIHGMGRLKWSMAHLGIVAKKYGYRPILFEYQSKQCSINEHAQNLLSFIKDNTDESTKELSVIGHSLGCIITSVASQDPLWVFERSRAVFLGPPNQGSAIAKTVSKIKFANWYFGTPLTELSNWKSVSPSKLQVGVIAGVLSYKRSFNPFLKEPNDTLVNLSETYLDGISQHRIIRCPHAVMMYHPTIIKESFNFIATGTFKND